VRQFSLSLLPLLGRLRPQQVVILQRPALEYGVGRPEAPALHSVRPGQPAEAVWQIASPYAIVGGKVVLRCRRGAADKLSLGLSADGKTWEPLWTADQTGAFDQTVVFDEKLSPRGKPQYVYFLRVEQQAAQQPTDVGLDALVVETDVQMAPLSLPELQVGVNKIEYTDDTPGPRQARITHAWIERTAWHPPTAPPQPISPADHATVEGTKLHFAWQPATDPDGDKIVDYHFELADRPDMRWTLSPNFERLTSCTPSKGRPEWTVPYVGLLNPNTEYYWRVRARDAPGVWGPWSPVWRFRCAAPSVPLAVTTSETKVPGQIVLSWQPNPVGRRPVRYKVYGSDEQGFSVSDTEYLVSMGKGFCDTMQEYNAKTGKEPDCGQVKTPANLLGQTPGTQLPVAGPGIELPNANKAFYRVVAVDQKGNESGPSDYAALPRPWVFTRPAATAKVGQRWEYQAGAIRSLGHLTCRDGYNAAFWGREKLQYQLVGAPPRLQVDASGLVTGTPDKAGEYQVTLVVTNNKGGKAEQRFALRVQ
jgi:hypothetical protein